MPCCSLESEHGDASSFSISVGKRKMMNQTLIVSDGGICPECEVAACKADAGRWAPKIGSPRAIEKLISFARRYYIDFDLCHSLRKGGGSLFDFINFRLTIETMFAKSGEFFYSFN
jgi:hypothetical protein